MDRQSPRRARRSGSPPHRTTARERPFIPEDLRWRASRRAADPRGDPLRGSSNSLQRAIISPPMDAEGPGTSPVLRAHPRAVHASAPSLLEELRKEGAPWSKRQGVSIGAPRGPPPSVTSYGRSPGLPFGGRMPSRRTADCPGPISHEHQQQPRRASPPRPAAARRIGPSRRRAPRVNHPRPLVRAP